MMIEELEAIVGKGNVLTGTPDLEAYSHDFSRYRERPLAVVLPGSREEVSGILKTASRDRIPIIPRGAGTNTCGEVVGKGIVLDMTRMDGIMEINKRDMYCRVRPGVVLDDLNKALAKEGLFFPPDPASSKVCTIGGMVSNNSSGLHSVKYGTTKDYVLGLEAVLPSGEVIRTGSLARKSSSGYNLTRLLVGSEGTLAVITEVVLKVLPLPETRKVLQYPFDDLGGLDRTLTQLMVTTRPSALEIVDDICIMALRERYGLEMGEGKFLLIVEYDGGQVVVEDQVEECRSMLGSGLDTQDPWSWRKNLVPALMNYKEGVTPQAVTEDISVPLSKVCNAIGYIKDIYGDNGLEVAIYGHGGDGNLHMRVFADEDSIDTAIALGDDVYEYVLSVEGSTTAEHGVGILRGKYMEKEHGSAMDLMRAVKKVFDPDGIMNPGKMGL